MRPDLYGMLGESRRYDVDGFDTARRRTPSSQAVPPGPHNPSVLAPLLASPNGVFISSASITIFFDQYQWSKRSSTSRRHRNWTAGISSGPVNASDAPPW
jgi:hypothetical protein